VATSLGLVAGSLGKIARDVALMLQPEVRELSLPDAAVRGVTSSPPYERHPLRTAAIVAAAARVPGLVATVLGSLPQEHERGLGGWQTESEVLPEICLLTSGALVHAILLFERLNVDTDRMRAIVHATSDPILGDVLRFALFRRIGPEAHALFERAWRRATHGDLSVRAVLETEQEATKRLTPAELKELCNPSSHLGLAEEWCNRALAEHARQNGETSAGKGA
jgi:3-carboxy-cis,cis-muconate cycloisomerase